MNDMSRFDHLDLDGHLLRLLVVVTEERSVTRAADRLGVTQSSVSHLLDKLRAIVGDPLFVRSGRGIVPTAQALELAQRAQKMLDEMSRFAHSGVFDPAQCTARIGIAANDMQRDLLLPRLYRRLAQVAPGITLHVMPSDVPTLEMMRDALCQLAISPRPPEAGDVLQKRLFEDRYRVFYDATQREPPASLDEYERCEHVTVVREPQRMLEIDRVLAGRGVNRRFVVTVSDFSGVRPFVLGSRRIATLPGLLRADLLRGLSDAEPPLECPVMPMYMLWHARHQADPMHEWLRRELEAVVAPALAAAAAPTAERHGP